HKHGRAWRLVPRLNPDVNSYWMCDEGRFTYHALREQRLAGAVIDGLPAGWDRAIRAAADQLAPALSNGARAIGVVLSAEATNEDNFALAKLAKAWGASVYTAGKPPVPGRADGRLRTDDVNPNTAGVAAIASALGLPVAPVGDLSADIRTLVMLGSELPGVDDAALAELSIIAIASHEVGPVRAARIALPAAAWAEVSGTITNHDGLVQRMHAAFVAPGQALPGWEAVVRLAQATGHKLAYAHAREVFKDMTQAVSAWSSLTWARDARPLALRFAGSRG
ncbi:MAG TPA: molybdopterin-dependent oxidoreductase, partial [Kofleriaceae bacterium]